MSSLILDVSYNVSVTTQPADLDVLFDEWLIPTQNYTGGSGGACEVEILPYYNFAELPGNVTKEFTNSVTINGTATSTTWDEYVFPPSNVTFVPHNSTGVQSGEVRFNALDFFNEAVNSAGLSTSWWIGGFELGNEFGDTTAANFTTTFTKIDIEQANN